MSNSPSTTKDDARSEHCTDEILDSLPPRQGMLESEEVLELQAFIERKEWIQSQIEFLESLPTVNIYGNPDGISKDNLPAEETREQLSIWLEEHDCIEKQTEQFDAGDLAKLRKFAKAATQRDLSPSDTDLIEITLDTLVALDKLLNLLRSRSDNLELLSLRLDWEDLWRKGWKEIEYLVSDMRIFLESRARWSQAIYKALSSHIVDRPNTADALVLSSPPAHSEPYSTHSRINRYKHVELLSHDAVQFSSRINSIKHTNVSASGKLLDKLIDFSRIPVPERLLDEQDRLEDRFSRDMEKTGAHIMHVVTQWKKSDELYSEALRDQHLARSLSDEIKESMKRHPSSDSGSLFLSRAQGLINRVDLRGDPASSTSSFPRPSHPLFPEQEACNRSIIQVLSSALLEARRAAVDAQNLAKKYQEGVEALNQTLSLMASISSLASRFESITVRIRCTSPLFEEDGLNEDYLPPDLNNHGCLDRRRYSSYISLFPTIASDIQNANGDAVGLLLQFEETLLSLRNDARGISSDFMQQMSQKKLELERAQKTAEKLYSDSVASIEALIAARAIWDRLVLLVQKSESIRKEIHDTILSCADSSVPAFKYAPEDKAFTPARGHLVLNELQASMQEVEATLNNKLSPFSKTNCFQHLKNSLAFSTSRLSSLRNLVELLGKVTEQSLVRKQVAEECQEMGGRLSHLLADINRDIGLHDCYSASSHEKLKTAEMEHRKAFLAFQLNLQSFLEDLPARVPFVGDNLSLNLYVPSHVISQQDAFDITSFIQHTDLDPKALLEGFDHAVRSEANWSASYLRGLATAIESSLSRLSLVTMAVETDCLRRASAALLDEYDAQVRSYMAEVVTLKNPLKAKHGNCLLALKDLECRIRVYMAGLHVSLDDSLARFRECRSRLNEFACSETYDDIVSTLRLDFQDLEQRKSHLYDAIDALQTAVMQALSDRGGSGEGGSRSELTRGTGAEDNGKISEVSANIATRREAKSIQVIMSPFPTGVEGTPISSIKLDTLPDAEIVHHSDKGFGQTISAPAEVSFRGDSSHGSPSTLSSTGLLCGSGADATSADVFGSSPSNEPHPISFLQSLRDLRGRIQALKLHELTDQSLADVTELPSSMDFERAERELGTVEQEIEPLQANASEDDLRTTLSNLRQDIEVSQGLMPHLRCLSLFTEQIVKCHAGFSELLEAIDNVQHQPSPLHAPESRTDNATSTCPKHNDVQDVVQGLFDLVTTAKKFSVPVNSDVRVRAEVARLEQTWDELKEMADEILMDRALQNSSAKSSGRNSSVSWASDRGQKHPKPRPFSSRASSQSSLSLPKSQPKRSASGTLAPHPQVTNRSVSGPISSSSSRGTSTLFNSTFASRSRTTSLTSNSALPTPATPSKFRSSISQYRHGQSPTFSEVSSTSYAHRTPSRTSLSHATFDKLSRWPRPKANTIKLGKSRQKYIPNPSSKLDVAVGNVVNNLSIHVNVEAIENGWQDQSGKYWIGEVEPKLCFCRILRSQTVMVRVGGGWVELTRFIKDHFADSFRILRESNQACLPPSRESWISAASLKGNVSSRPHTPESSSQPAIPSFAFSTPSGKRTPQSIGSSPQSNSSLTPFQFFRKAEPPSVSPSPLKTGRKVRTSVANTPVHTSVWRP